jgi:hypothetical protein
MASTYAGGMVGAYRSYVPRYAAHDVVGALVSTDVADETAAQTLVQCIGARELAPTPPSSAAPIPPARIVGKSRILIIKDGVITPTDTFLGSPHGFQYNHIFQRMAGLAMWVRFDRVEADCQESRGQLPLEASWWTYSYPRISGYYRACRVRRSPNRLSQPTLGSCCVKSPR